MGFLWLLQKKSYQSQHLYHTIPIKNSMLPKEIEQDEKLQRMYLRKNLTPRRIEAYSRVFRKLYNLTNLTPSDIIRIAKDEQKPRIVDGEIVFKDLEDRTIADIQYRFYESMRKDGLKNETIKTELNCYRAFLKEYDIQTPKPINLTINTPLYETGDIPNKEDILRAINSTNNKRDKALIYTMSSSGIRPVDIRNLRIKDLLQGCKYYFGYDPQIEDILNADYDEIIPSFFFRPRKTSKHNNICCTFCSNEAMKSIIDYLQSRHIRSNDDYLFASRTGGKLGRSTLIGTFKRINDKTFGANRFGGRYFQAKYLRKYFISTCNAHSGDLLKVRLLSGHTISNVDRAYNEVNINQMRRFYISLLPYLNLHSSEVRTVKSKEYQDLERKLKKQELENEKLREELDEKINQVVEDVLRKYR